jgi:CheY-like chemotaxis protein
MTNFTSQPLVVIVEDDVLERMFASEMFSDAGYRVLAADYADEAVRLFETTEDIALLFTDVSMPGSMSGSDLARLVAERWPKVGIIIASGRPRPDKLPLRICFLTSPMSRQQCSGRQGNDDFTWVTSLSVGSGHGICPSTQYAMSAWGH